MADYVAPSKSIVLGGMVVKMPYAKLMDLQRMVPDPASAMTLVMTDPMTQDYIVRRCLTDKAATIKSEDDLIADHEVMLDSDQTEQLLTWVVQHLLYFFVKRTQGLAKVGTEFKEALPNLSLNGSETSASTEQSAGPSA